MANVVESRFVAFVRAIGGEIATSEDFRNGTYEGKYKLDHQSAYGGYSVVLMCENMGEDSNVFAGPRRRASEMINTFNFAIDAIKVAKGG